MKYGLIGKTLTHSISPCIHKALGCEGYELRELLPGELPAFFEKRAFDGINVTIPYKEAVMPFCDELSPEARLCRNVNTIVKRSDGSLFGDNTDLGGFLFLLKTADFSLKGRKVAILGSGGAAKTVMAAAEAENAAEIRILSRSGKYLAYENTAAYADSDFLVNCTPVGMFPHSEDCPVDLAVFSHLEGVADLIYHPGETVLLKAAKDRGIPSVGGLWMLAEQARLAEERFAGKAISEKATAKAVEAGENYLRSLL